MGSQQSSSYTISSKPQPIEVREVTHLGKVTVLRSRDQLCFRKYFHLGDGFVMEERLRGLKGRASRLAGNPHALNIYAVNKHVQQQLCASSHQLQVYLEHTSGSLQDDIDRRLSQRSNYSESEIIEILARALESLIYLQDNGLRNIHIDPSALLLTQLQQVKVLDAAIAYSPAYTWAVQQFQGTGSSQLGRSRAYLSPELLSQAGTANWDPYVSPKADVWGLGLVVLEMVTLESMTAYYDYAHATMDYDSLIHRLSRINHSLPLKTLLAEMLEYDPEERIGIVSLKEKLNALRQSKQPIQRSRSAKMLKELLSQSRSTSCKKPTPPSSREQSARRPPSSSPTHSRPNTPFKPSVLQWAHPKQQSMPQVEFKNLVRNKLARPKQITPQSSNQNICPAPAQPKVEKKKAEGESRAASDRQPLREQYSLQFESSLNWQPTHPNKSQSSLSKLVESKGVAKLLKMEQLQTEPSHPTHTFTRLTHSRKDSIRTQQLQKQSSKFQQVETKATPNGQSLKKKEKTSLTFSPIAAQEAEHSESLLAERNSPDLKVTIKDVPVVISQEKGYQAPPVRSHFGQLQRHLNLQDAQSVEQDSPQNMMEHSKVIEAYKAREEVPSPLQTSPQKRSAFLKKRNKPHLQLDLLDSAQSHQSGSNQNSQVSPFQPRLIQPCTPTPPTHLLPLAVSAPHYQGAKTDGLPHDGVGELTYPNKYHYKGEFSHGKFNGCGCMTNLSPNQTPADYTYLSFEVGNWVSFDGEFAEGVKSGFGMVHFADGSKFSGCWKGGTIQGYGCFYKRSGELVSGFWKGDRLSPTD